MNAPTSNRRWFRYSLRTMLVLVTLLCVWLATEVDRVQKMRRAIEVVERHGGSVQYQYQRSGFLAVDMKAEVPGPRWLRNLLGDDYFRSINTVMLHPKRADNLNPLYRKGPPLEPLSDAELALLGTQKSLELLSIDMPLKDEGFKKLRGLTNLKGLLLWNTELTDDCFSTIARFEKLEQLAVMSSNVMSDDDDGNRSPITDAGCASIRGLTNLTNLRLAGSRITDAGMAYLQGLTRLESLDLDCTDVADGGLAQLQRLPLNSIYLNRTKVTRDGARSLMSVPTLELISFPDEQVHAFNTKNRANRDARIKAQRVMAKAKPAATGS